VSSPKGFSIVELMVVVIIISLLAVGGVPLYNRMIGNHKLYLYGDNMEYLVKYAKILAMQRTTNVGVCVADSSHLRIYDIGTSRGAGICTGTIVVSMTITSQDSTSFGISVSGSGASFDPRGLAIMLGNVCVTNNIKYTKAFISRTAIRMEKKDGGCH